MSFVHQFLQPRDVDGVVLEILGLQREQIERFRYSWIEDGELGITARTGGGNREDHLNEALTSHPNYLYDSDDEFDCTYAHYRFSIPAGAEDRVAALTAQEPSQ